MEDFDFQPVLVSDAVILRPIKAEDWAELYQAASDPEIWKLHPVHDRYTEPAFKTFFCGALASKTAFTLVDPASGALIGSSRYYGYDRGNSEVEIGWTFIMRDHWGGRVNGEAKRLMLDHAFNFVDTAIFWVGEDNLRSQRAVEKIGGIRRPGMHVRELAGPVRHFIYEVRKDLHRRRNGEGRSSGPA